ncbi:MAG TPA: alpha/beta fold hydrolase [Solirubrobacterales bacterium]|nr:alpha/beta fold hydrolase [Solirubrobacterales bacterium]
MAASTLPGAEGFELGDGPVGALLVHGFSSSPQTMRGLGEHLAARGVRVSAPLLPGHGTDVYDFAKRRPEEWVAAVREAYEALAERCDPVFVVGVSFGSALAVDLAADLGDKAAGLVLLASVVEVEAMKRAALWLIRWFVPTVKGVGNDISEPSLRCEVGYDRLPTGVTYRMARWLTGLPGRMEEVRAPALIMHGRHDHEAPAANPRLLHERLGSLRKELVWLERSWHVITLDVEREAVYARVGDFVSSLSSGSGGA